MGDSLTHERACTKRLVYTACRGEALKVVMDFSANAGLLHAAQLLFQLEVLLLHSGLSDTEVSHTPWSSFCGNYHARLQSVSCAQFQFQKCNSCLLAEQWTGLSVRVVWDLQADKDEQEAEVDCKCQLLLVLAEVTLDGSTPLICCPLFATLFCQAASGAVPISPHTKVSTAPGVSCKLATYQSYAGASLTGRHSARHGAPRTS